MPQEAYKQLREIYDEPIAHYDLGFLLNKHGMKAAALQEFTIALQLSPGMTLARQWVERLSRERGESDPAVVGMTPPPPHRGQQTRGDPCNPWRFRPRCQPRRRLRIWRRPNLESPPAQARM